jgi:hypothetical protein
MSDFRDPICQISVPAVVRGIETLNAVGSCCGGGSGCADWARRCGETFPAGCACRVGWGVERVDAVLEVPEADALPQGSDLPLGLGGVGVGDGISTASWNSTLYESFPSKTVSAT